MLDPMDRIHMHSSQARTHRSLLPNRPSPVTREIPYHPPCLGSLESTQSPEVCAPFVPECAYAQSSTRLHMDQTSVTVALFPLAAG